MQPNELPSLCWTPHLFPRVLPSDFTLSFLSLVQYIHSAAAHVVPSYLLSQLLSQVVQLTTLVHIWLLGTSQWIFFSSSLPCSLCSGIIFFLLHFFQAGYWASWQKLKFRSQWIISLSKKTPPGFSHQPARKPACHTAAVLIRLSINPHCAALKVALKTSHLGKLQSAAFFTHSAANRRLSRVDSGSWSLDCIPDVFG